MLSPGQQSNLPPVPPAPRSPSPLARKLVFGLWLLG